MIVVDTSALIAILDKESDAALYAEAIADADAPLISTATLLEVNIVMLNRHGARAAPMVDRFIQEAGFQVESFTVQHAELESSTWSESKSKTWQDPAARRKSEARGTETMTTCVLLGGFNRTSATTTKPYAFGYVGTISGR